MKVNWGTWFAVVLSLLLLLMIVAPTGKSSQDPNFRLMNIERRLDQLQNRLDFIERAQQNQAMQANTATSNMTTETMLELQRQHLSLAEQVVRMQKRMLEMQKTIDQLAEREPKSEKKEPVESKLKSKAPASKP